jgi:hypothetical protein
MPAVPGPIVTFFGSLERNDYAAARACLADAFSFTGWFDDFDSPDDYIEAVKRLRGYTTRVDVRQVFVDGADVAVFYDTHTIHGDVAPVAAWITLEGDRIARIRVICDNRPFAALWERP